MRQRNENAETAEKGKWWSSYWPVWPVVSCVSFSCCSDVAMVLFACCINSCTTFTSSCLLAMSGCSCPTICSYPLVYLRLPSSIFRQCLKTFLFSLSYQCLIMWHFTDMLLVLASISKDALNLSKKQTQRKNISLIDLLKPSL